MAVVMDLPLGAHQSIAGGTPRAVERGVEVDQDRKNLAVLRRLASSSPSPRSRGEGRGEGR